MLDYETGLTNIISEYQASDGHRWKSAFAMTELWQTYPDRHGEIMSVLVAELKVTDDQIYHLLHAATLAGATESNRNLVDRLSPSHYSRLARAAEKYDLPAETVTEYLELASENSWSAQTMIEQVSNNHDPDERIIWNRAVRAVVKACRRLLELAESNGVKAAVREAAKILVKELEEE